MLYACAELDEMPPDIEPAYGDYRFEVCNLTSYYFFILSENNRIKFK